MPWTWSYAQSGDSLLISGDTVNFDELRLDYFHFESTQDTKSVKFNALLHQDHHFDVVALQEDPHIHLGNHGSASRSLWPSVLPGHSFDIGIHIYDPYIFREEDLVFYSLPHAYTHLFASQGKAYQNSDVSLQNNTLLDIRFSRDFQPGINFVLDYRKIKEAGSYENEISDHTAIRTGLMYQSNNSKYSSALSYCVNNIRVQQSGGIVDVSRIFNDTFDVRGGIPVHLEAAEHRYRSNAVHWKNRYDLVRKDSNALHMNYQLSYVKPLFLSIDDMTASIADSIFYQQFLTDSRGLRHQISASTWKNTAFIEWNNPYIRRIRAGISHANYDTDQGLHTRSFNFLTLSGNLDLQIGRWMSLDNSATIELWDHAGDFNLISLLSMPLNKWGTIHMEARLKQQEPSLLENHLEISEEMVWKNNFKKKQSTSLGAHYYHDKLGVGIGVNQQLYNNFIHFDRSAAPVQLNEVLHLTQVRGRADLQLGVIHLNNEIFYQTFTHNVFYAPSLFSRHDVYYQNRHFSEKMFLRFGLEAHLFDAYTLPAFQPAIGQFYDGSGTKSDPQYLIDFYVNFLVAQFNTFIKLTNVVDLFGQQNYFLAENYPMRDWTIRFGIGWTYLD